MKKLLINLSIYFILTAIICNICYAEEQIEGSVKTDSPAQNDSQILPLAPKLPDIYSRTMIKQRKYTSYMKNMDVIIPVLVNLKQSIENKEGIQKFCANSNILNFYVTDLEKTYKNKPESYYGSYKQIVKANNTVLEVANYLRDTQKFKRVRWNAPGSKATEKEILNKKLDSALKSINLALEILKDI